MAARSKVMGPVRAKLELCVGSYHAEQIGQTVILTATGVHPTSGYDIFFEQSPIDVFPPEYSLWHKNPSGVTLQVVTPYSESVHFISAVPVKRLVVHDANGSHNVTVEQAASHIRNHLKKLSKDGPFPMSKRLATTLSAMTVAASGSNDAWTNLKRVLSAWSKVAAPGIGDKLVALWTQNAGGQSYPNIGVPNLINSLKGDMFFGPCPATGTLQAAEFLPNGKYDSVSDLLDELDSCGS